MYGRVDPTDDRVAGDLNGTPGRHRGRSSMSAPVALGLTVTALLSAFGIGAAVLPDSLTGPGAAGESPAAAIAQLEQGAGGAADTEPTTASADLPGAPSAPAASTPAGRNDTPGTDPSGSPTPAPSASRAAAPKPSATTTKPRPRATTKKPAPKPTTPKASSAFEAMENEVIALTNVERGKNGCGDLTMNTKLRTAMRLHVQELAAHDGLYISHVSDDGRSFVDRARAQGYTDLGAENVARGQSTPADVMNSWMNSEGHRANILNCGLKAIGVGVAEGDGSLVWGQIFGNS